MEAEAQRSGGLTQLSPVENIMLHERVYRELKDALMNGRFAAGEALTLRSLAGVLGTSIMPVREAVRLLVASRALEVLPNRKVRVPLLTLPRFEQLCQVRQLIEGQAIADAVERAEDKFHLKLRAINAELETCLTSGDRNAIFRVNRQFHFTAYQPAGNDFLMSMIESSWIVAGPYLVGAVVHEHDKQRHKALGLNHHNRIIAAFRRRDPQAARDALMEDIKETSDVIRAHLIGAELPTNEGRR